MTNPHVHITDNPIVPDLSRDTAAPVANRTAAQVAALLQEEIRILRNRGFSDECIHDLFTGFKIEAQPEPFGHEWRLPLDDQLIRLIWGKMQPTPVHLD
jgi:hypothetical protein